MWLHVDNHWLNMAHALIVDDDMTSTPQAVSVVFSADVKRTITGESRQQVLAWLSRQAQWAQGGVIQGNMPYIVGEHPPVSAARTAWISPEESTGKRQ